MLIFLVVFLLCLLSFGAGILVQSYIDMEKPQTEFQQNQ